MSHLDQISSQLYGNTLLSKGPVDRLTRAGHDKPSKNAALSGINPLPTLTILLPKKKNISRLPIIYYCENDR